MLARLLRLFGVLMVLSAILLALSRAPDRPVEGLVARWAPPPSDFIEVKGQAVHVRDEGPRHDTLPIVLIHGTASSLHTWQGWARELRGQHRVISVDLPGFGLTGPFAGQYLRDDYHGDRYARFVLDLLDVLRVPRAVMAGNSLGGEVAWRTAAMEPARVAGLVLVDAWGPVFKPESGPLAFWIARAPIIGDLSQGYLPRALVAQGLASVYAQPEHVTAELVDRHFELALREGNRRALTLRLRQAVAGEHTERIAALKQPTLILWGAQDRLIPPLAGRQFQQWIAGSRLEVLEGLGHMPQEEDPARSVAPVKAFLQTLR